MIASHRHTRRRAACWLKPQSELRPRHETDKRRKGGGGGAVPHSRQGKWLGLLLRKRATLLRNVCPQETCFARNSLNFSMNFFCQRKNIQIALTNKFNKIQSNSVITNSTGPSVFVCYNIDSVITVKVYIVK